MLSSHLEMLHSARNAARDDDNMAQIISSMLEKTNRLASQFRVVKKQIVCLCHFFILFLLMLTCGQKNGERILIQTPPRMVHITCDLFD